MTTTGLEAVDRAQEITNTWLNEIMEGTGPDLQAAWHALAAVLQTIRDRLQPDLAAQFGSQLPLIIRGIYYDGYRPSAAHEAVRSLDEFLSQIKGRLEFTSDVDVTNALRTVSRVLARHMGEEPMAIVWRSLPEEIRRSAKASQADPQNVVDDEGERNL